MSNALRTPRLLVILAVLLLVGFQAETQAQGEPCCPNPWPARAGYVLVDDIWMPADAMVQEGNWTGSLWTNADVRFHLDPVLNSEERRLMRTAFHELEAVCGISFIEMASNPSGDYIHVVRSTDSGVSSSEVGRQGGSQYLRVWSDHWTRRIVLMHETMHALGFRHEQARPDRDAYVTINENNIQSGREHNFDLDSSAAPIGPYDFLSIMHYGPRNFAVNENLNTITCKPAYSDFQDQIGNRVFISQGDCNSLQAYYGAPSVPIASTCVPFSVQAGTGSIEIEVSGSWFYEGPIVTADEPGSVVLFNGTAIPTSYVDNHTLRATIPSNLLQNPGSHQIRVRNHAEAGGTSTTNATFVTTCGSLSASLGQSAAGMGDVNNDGCDDYVVGSPGENSQTGRLACYSGKSGAVIWAVLGPGTNSGMGQSVTNVGDVNGDGKDDCVVGLPYYNSTTGRIELRSGATGGLLNATNPGFSGGYFGERVQVVGDIDGDGDQEYLVSAPTYNSSRGRVELRSASGTLLRFHEGTIVNEAIGFSLAGGYDMTGDGVPDYAIGSPFYSGLNPNRGRIRIYNGASGVIETTRDGDGEYDYFGTGLAMMPNTQTPSGKAHLVVGAPERGRNTGQSIGAGYVRIFSGSSTLPTFNYSALATWSGAAVGDCYGSSIAYAGDANDDGAADVLIGAEQDDSGPNSPVGHGFAEVRSGIDWSLMAKEQHLYVFNSPPTGGSLGYSVAWIGDKNGDGHLDYLAGEPDASVPCSNTGGFQTFAAKVPPARGRVLITEVSAGSPDGVEICNFGTVPIGLTNWRLHWRDGSSNIVSAPLNITLQPQEIAVILETGGVASEVPPGIQVVNAFASIGTTTSDFCVALINPKGLVVDEVRVAGSSGTYGEPSIGGKFRGFAKNEQFAIPGQIFFPSIHCERAPGGLDSNSGGDWYSSLVRSFGLENRCSGLRGFDTKGPYRVVLNEFDTSPDYVELYNATGTSVSMVNWYLLTSANQNVAHTVVTPPWSISGFEVIFPAGQYMVVGDTAVEPSEMPSNNVSYFNVGGAGIPWTTQEFDCALYDHFGRLVDLARVTRAGAEVVHNHPRAPASPLDFKGAAIQGLLGDGSTGRNHQSIDNDSGLDWRPSLIRSMGASNTQATANPFWYPSTLPQLDVRLNSTRAGGGLTMIINGGPEHAGKTWTFAFSGGHLDGTGPILGLGPDAVNNWLITSVTPPWFGVLDADGSARLDVPGGSVPPGLQTDDIFLLQDANLNFVHWTKVLQFDS